jgi:hypothetical protein
LWNVNEVTKSLYRDGNISGVEDFARKWGFRMFDVFTEDSKISQPSNGIVGIFVGNVDHQISAKMIMLRITEKGMQPTMYPLIPDNKVSYFGYANRLIEFDANQTRRAKIWHRRLDQLDPDAQIVALAKLQRDNDDSGTVGGKIDSIRIDSSGVRWSAVKKECDNE